MEIKKRNYAIDFLKILATIIIVFHHYQQVTHASFPNMINFYYGNFYWGYIVELFFIISGLFMYKYIADIQANKISFKEFYLKRVLRFLPLLAISAIVYEAIIITYTNLNGGALWLNIKPTLWGTIIDSLGIQAGWVFSNPYVNNPTWYCSVLLLCYLVFFIITKLAKKLKISPTYLYIFMILLGCAIKTYKINQPFLNSYSCRGYYAFFTGIILAKYLEDRKINIWQSLVSIGVIAGFILLYKFQKSLVTDGLIFILTFLVYPAIIILFNAPFIQKIFNFNFIGVMAKVSFDVYIWHNPMLPLMYVFFKVTNVTIDFNKIKWMLAFVVLSYIVGIISYFLIEMKINKLINKVLNKKKLNKEINNMTKKEA